MERINFEQERRGLELDLEEISNQCPEDYQEARMLSKQENFIYASLKDLEYLQENDYPNPINSVKLKAIIGKAKNGEMARLDGSKGRMTDNDKHEIEGILQDYSFGRVTFKSAYRTNSKDISTSLRAEKGNKLYIETDALDERASFYDIQGFYQGLSEWGYSIVDSRIKIRN